MPVNYLEVVPLGRTKLSVGRLGFGMAPLGGLYAPVTDEQAASVLAHAWDLGIRYYDAAPSVRVRPGRAAPRANAAAAPARRVRGLHEGRPAALPAGRGPGAPGAGPRLPAPGLGDGHRRRDRRRGPERLVLPRRSRCAPGLRLQLRRHHALGRVEPEAHRPAPSRHPVDPRPRHPLGAGHRRRLPGPRRPAEPGRRVGDRRRHEPVRDAHPVRPRGRLRRLHAGRALHPARPAGARRPAARSASRRTSPSSSPAS